MTLSSRLPDRKRSEVRVTMLGKDWRRRGHGESLIAALRVRGVFGMCELYQMPLIQVDRVHRFWALRGWFYGSLR